MGGCRRTRTHIHRTNTVQWEAPTAPAVSYRRNLHTGPGGSNLSVFSTAAAEPHYDHLVAAIAVTGKGVRRGLLFLYGHFSPSVNIRSISFNHRIGLISGYLFTIQPWATSRGTATISVSTKRIRKRGVFREKRYCSKNPRCCLHFRMYIYVYLSKSFLL